jgi:MFS family permease
MRLIGATRPWLVHSPFVTTMPEDKAGTRKVYKDHNLHVLFGVTLMAVLGVSSITPALPEIRDTFGVTSGQVGLLITVFTLPGVALTPVLGVLSDRHGRRKILVPALLLFGITGGLCAFARGFELLLALRLMQGMGAAAAVAWHGRLRVAGEGRWLVPVALVFAVGLAWRDSAMIFFLNLLAFLVAVSLAALWGRSGRLRLAGVSEYVLGGI